MIWRAKMSKKILLMLSLLTILLMGCNQLKEATKPECNKPYILVGWECCLDNDGNGVCDNDETKEVQNEKEQGIVNEKSMPEENIPVCKSPYYEYKTGECCLDKNNNKVCDEDETGEQEPTTEENPIVSRPSCEDVTFDITSVCKMGKSTYKILISNNANIDLTGFNFKFYESLNDYADEDYIDTFEAFGIKSIEVETVKDEVIKIEAIPTIQIEGERITCFDKKDTYIPTGNLISSC